MYRALLVGIDEYPEDPLSGCVRDANRMREVLGRNEDDSLNFECHLLTAPADDITRQALRDGIRDLFASPAHAALFYFAGHGSANDLGGFLITPDIENPEDGFPMRDLFELARQATNVREVIIILDCCASGAIGDDAMRVGRNAEVTLRQGLSILTASRSTETAAETDEGGIFTALIVAALSGGAADVLGLVTVPSVYAYVDRAMGAWDQRPLMKSHVTNLLSLRRCVPRVTLAELHRLPKFFKTSDADYPLDPSYEPTMEPHDAEHERIFRILQKCRDANLLVPVGAEHLYYAAVNSTACRLTPSGRFYWQLVSQDRL
jgi:hypothetical protein